MHIVLLPCLEAQVSGKKGMLLKFKMAFTFAILTTLESSPGTEKELPERL